MNPAALLRDMTRNQQLNFLLTNRIPRRWATLIIGWFSRIEQPWLCRLSIAIWRLFADDLDLSQAEKREFSSLQDCFTRRLKPGSRPVAPAPDAVVSPCDGIVGMHGPIRGTAVFQAKGFPYDLADLLPDPDLVERYSNGRYLTLRLTSSMYHRFHAPCDCRVDEVIYVSGDTWNVNPIALQRIEKLYCKNERAVVELKPGRGEESIALVPVAAILVAGIRLHCLDPVLDLRYRGPNRLACAARYAKGEEMGYFQHGSTIIMLTTPGIVWQQALAVGEVVRAGQGLMRFRSLPA